MNAYIVLSLLTGARTEELRALTWKHVDLIGAPNSEPLVPPTIEEGFDEVRVIAPPPPPT